MRYLYHCNECRAKGRHFFFARFAYFVKHFKDDHPSLIASKTRFKDWCTRQKS